MPSREPRWRPLDLNGEAVKKLADECRAKGLVCEGYQSVAKQLADKFGFEMVAITLRESHSAFDNG